MGCQIFKKSSVVEPTKDIHKQTTAVQQSGTNESSIKDQKLQNENTAIEQNDKSKQKSDINVVNENVAIKQLTQPQKTQVTKKIQQLLIIYPKRKDILKQYIQCGLSNKSIHLQNKKKYINIIDEIINQIYLNELNFSNLQTICQKQKISIMDAIFLRNDCDETILTLILTYIDDYEIIKEVMKNHKLPENNYELLDLATSLLRKFRPQTSIDNINKSIEFLDTFKQSEQLQKVFNSFNDPDILRVQNAINYAQNCISYFNQKKQIHLLLLRKIAKLFDQQFEGLFIKQYRDWKQGFSFKKLKVPKVIPKTTSEVTNLIKIELEMLNYTLFHEIAIQQNWELFIQYSNPYYRQKSLDQRTPFWIFIQKAPISIIVDYISQFPKELEKNIQIITKQGLTLIHCLCKNPNLLQKDQETINKLIKILQQHKIVKTLLDIPYYDQIPLVYYLDTQKITLSIMITFLSSYLMKQFNFEKIEMESYQIADQILNGKKSIQNLPCYFKSLSKEQQKIIKQEWHINKNKYVQQSNEYQNFTQFYLHYIQLAKQIIKKNLFDQFPWVNNYSMYSSHFPYDIGNVGTSLLYTLLIQNRFQQLQVQIESICKSIESQKYQPQKNPQEYQQLVQQISKLVFIYQELFNQSENQQLQQLIQDTVYNQIKQNPQIILNKIYGSKKNESMADYIPIQYIMRIKADKELYNKFINILIERLDKNLFKGKMIKINLKIQNYNNFKAFKINNLNIILPQQDYLIIPLQIQTKNVIVDSINNDENYQNYYDFKNVLQEIINRDNQFNFFINDQTVILGSNLIIQILLEKNSQLHQLYNQSFFSIKSLWYTSQFIKYDFKQIIPYILDQQNTIVKINQLEKQQYEQIFDWQLQGMKVEFCIIMGNLKDQFQGLKEQVIYNQIKNKQQFWSNLIIYDEFNTEVQQYFNIDEDKPQLIRLEQIPLYQIISNKSFINLQYLINLIKISQYELVQILADYFFIRQTSLVLHKPIKERIMLFNVQMRELIAQITTNPFEIKNLQICTLDKFINYLEIDTISRFNKKLLYDLINNSKIYQLINKCLMYKQIRQKEYYFSLEWQDQILEIILDYWKDNQEELKINYNYLKLAQQRSPVVAKWLLLRMISDDQLNMVRKTNPLYFYCIHSPNEAQEWIEKVDLKIWMKRFLFGYFINLDQSRYPNKKILIYKMINKIKAKEFKTQQLFISNIKNYDSFFTDNRQFTWNANGIIDKNSTEKNKLFQKNQFKYRSEELKYVNIIYYQYYMVLSNKEYQEFIDTINLNEEEYFQQIQFFILSGLKDKLQIILNKLKKIESFQKIYNLSIFTKRKCLEHEFGFDILIDIQFDIEQYFEFPFHFSFQKTICNFMNYEQVVDYIGTFQYLNEELKKKKLQLSNEIIQVDTLFDILIFPNVTKIQLNQKLTYILMQIYLTRKSNSKYKYKEKQNRSFSEFLAERQDFYIKLLGANIQDCEIQFTKVYYFTTFQCTFFEQLFLLLSQDKYKVKYNKNEIANLIIINNLQNEKFNKIIENGQLEINNLNQTFKYYFKKCNLLKCLTLNLQQKKFYKAKLTFLSSCMSIDNFSFDSLQNTEIAFILKGHEYIDNKLNFDQKYLVASLLSNNLDTIIFVMQLHKDPITLGFEQNIFQILIIYSNEKDIITYYNKFVYKQKTDNKRLFSLNNVPLLYYIVFKRYSQVFFEVYLKQLQIDMKENEINKFIQEQLQMTCFESDETIYQLALQQKSYFLLDYMKSFIKVEEIEKYVDNYDFNLLNRIQNYPIQSELIQEFIKVYQSTQKFHKYFHKVEYRLPEKENKVLKDENRAREDQINLLIIKEQATLMKIFGFNQNILKFVEIHYGFSSLIFEIVMLKLNRFKGNPQIIQDYLQDALSQNKTINKDLIYMVMDQVQKIYIMDHPVFLQIIQLFPTQLYNALRPQNFILENCLQVALTQINANQKSKDDFYKQNDGEIDQNILLMMKIIVQPSIIKNEQNIFKDGLLNISEQILLSTKSFLSKNRSYKMQEITQDTRDFLIKLMSEHIKILDQSQLWKIVLASNDYIPIFSEFLYVRKIERICELLKNYLNFLSLTEDNYQPQFMINFEDVQIYQLDNQIILPLEYNKDEIYFSQEKFNKLIEQFKQIRLEKNIAENIKTILKIEEYQQNNIMGELEGNYSIEDLEAPHQGNQNTFQRQVTQLEKQQTIFEKKQTENPNQKQIKQEDIKFMKENYDFMLELVNNNNYKGRVQQTNKIQTIFMEYYHFQNPKELIVNLEQCKESEFIKKYNGRESISFVISQFYKYHENIKQLIGNQDYKQWQITFPYYIKDNKFYSERSLFSTYTIQIIFQKLYEFHENIKQYARNLGDVEKIQWRISAISTLEVLISNMIDFNMYDNKSVDILSLLDSILNWNSLKMVILQVLYCNMLKYQNILSVLRRIYVEFNEIQEIPFENMFQERGLDQYFRFGQTHYFLQQQTLIIRLNIMKNKMQPQLKQQISVNQQNQSYNFLKQQDIDYYYCNIINEEDLLFQIFNSQQIIQYLFKKLDVDRQLQQTSQNLSKILNKDVILSINHQSLLDILQSEIQQVRLLKDRKQQLQMQSQIKELLINLSEFFLDKSEQLLINQIQSHIFEYQFQTKLSSLLHSLRQGFNRSLDNVPNHRKIVAVQKAKVITKIRYPNRNCDKLISLYFGFQLKTNYYISKSRIGDLLIVVYKNEYQYPSTMLCQLVDNSRQGKLIFYRFDESSTSTLSQEQFEQYCAMSNKMKKDQSYDDQIEIIDNENIIAAVLFLKGWPDDSDFINNIINLYITDQNGNLYFIHEQRLAKKMIQISESDSESIKQQLLDAAFGKNQIQTYSSFTVCEIIPIFPNQIIYEFESGKFKQQKSNGDIENSQKMIIKINEIDFQIDKLKLDLLNIACYFDSNDTAQYHVKKLTQFKESHNELTKIQILIKFSDDLNQNPSYYLDNIMQSQISFVEFQQGYETFFVNKYIPQIENALSFMFDINQAQIKKNLIMNVFKVIEFTYELTVDNQEQLISFEKGVLKLKTLLIERPNKNISIEVPSENKIGQFINQLIVNFKKNNFNDLLVENTKFEISIDQNYEKEYELEILTLILITKYLYKLISIRNDKKIIFKITKSNSKSITLYQFSKDRSEVQLFYDKFQDFRLADFLLDYLNNYTNQYTTNYTELDKKILWKNQLMMQSMIFNVDDFIKKEKQQVEQYELNIYYGENKIKKLEGRLDPRDFETAFIIIKNKTFQKVVCVKSCQKYSPLIQYLKQNSQEQKCGFPIYILINGVYEYLSLDEQLSKIKVITKNNIEKPLTFYKNFSNLLKAKVKFITSNILFVEFTCSKPLEFTIKSNQYQIACIKQDFTSEITLKFLPTLDSQMYKFYHTGITFQNEFKQINQEEQQSNKIKGYMEHSNKFLKLIMKSLEINEDMKFEQQQQNINLNQILNNNVLNIQRKQLIKQSTKVGLERLDVIEIKDNFGNKATNFTLQSIVLIHSIYQKIYIIPKYTRENNGLNIYWEPQIKGIYYLYINNQKVDSQFVVLANQVDIDQSKVDFPEKLKSIPYYQEIAITVQLKDNLQNIYGSIENSLDNVKLELISSHKKSNIEQNCTQLSLEGKLEVTMRFLPIEEENLTEKDEIELILKINDKEKMRKQLFLEGVSFQKNMQDFQKSILYDNDGKKIYKVEKQLLIQRSNFLESLLKYQEDKLKGPVMIKFQNEAGYDQGGPRKEFFILIGNELKGENLKSEQYGYFSMLTPGYYFIDPRFLLIPKKNEIASIFGKFVANSIFNNHQIGIQFQPQFWKVVFQEKIQFKDLNGFLDPITYQNYDSLLTYDDQIFEQLYLNFTYQKKKEQIILIPDGQNVMVSKGNCQIYLDKVAEYLIQTQYQDIYTPFIQGFQTVLEVQNLKKYFKPNDMGLITLGVQEIKPEQLIKMMKFKGGQDYHCQYFITYVNSLNSKKLKELLQFITGTPTLSSDVKFSIQVEFKQDIKETLIPITRTCFNAIELPLYKTYAEMKQKLDIAISYGLLGFGIF